MEGDKLYKWQYAAINKFTTSWIMTSNFIF